MATRKGSHSWIGFAPNFFALECSSPVFEKKLDGCHNSVGNGVPIVLLEYICFSDVGPRDDGRVSPLSAKKDTSPAVIKVTSHRTMKNNSYSAAAHSLRNSMLMLPVFPGVALYVKLAKKKYQASEAYS